MAIGLAIARLLGIRRQVALQGMWKSVPDIGVVRLRWYDVLGIWRDWAVDVRGHAIDCGHYLAEEAPDETYAALHAFFTGE